MGSIPDLTHQLRTGDTVLFSSNTPTAFMLRTLTASFWNHSGIAIRVKPDGKISSDYEGKLYILETNLAIRYDAVFNEMVDGIGFSEATWVFSKYNCCAARFLHDKFRNEQFGVSTIEYVKSYRHAKFPSSLKPFAKVWIGISFDDGGSGGSGEEGKEEKDKERQEAMFCSEFMASYYSHCLGEQYKRLTGNPFEGDLSVLFGVGSPQEPGLFSPESYSHLQTPNAPIYNGKEQMILVHQGDLLYVIVQPLIIVIFFMLLLMMGLPKFG